MSGFKNLRDIQAQYPTYKFQYATEDHLINVVATQHYAYKQGDPLSCGLAIADRLAHPHVTPYIFDTVAYRVDHLVRTITKYVVKQTARNALQEHDSKTGKASIRAGIYVLHAPTERDVNRPRSSGTDVRGTGVQRKPSGRTTPLRHVPA